MKLPNALIGLAAAVLGVTAVPAPVAALPPDVPVSWGYKCYWLAIRGADTPAVVRALGLKGARPSGWEAGVKAAYEGAFFVTPPVDGWVFVVSRKLPDAGDERHPNLIAPYITRLSRQLACEVQYFGTYRVVDYYAWMRATNGKLSRGFALADGSFVMNEGALTRPEADLKVVFKDEEAYFASERLVDEEDVMTIAGKWSLNPQTFEGSRRKVGLGVLGSAGP